ncbi:methyltransferase domain-containing protein [Streptosporangium saharense]|uniref:Protein-L-isoaspartate O-methyltransferase n=1 Tax=Streptosporangium saharense TaxID=1706840 RepID=A0A7W7VLB5_9ACTN|nr:methyltransferase domain-containing protein [Streptosporangium saharense]MBB4914502.1 protein-L-isoaspartate(D-aspartate) O-methyltransferase [Streptosporangium saharense]
MSLAEQEWQQLRDALLTSGAIAPDWVRAYEAVPRALFLPEVMWPAVDGEHPVVVKGDDPQEWERWAARNISIVTQWDDGRHSGPEPGDQPSSSSSMPSAVFSMFADLSVFDGARVLEIGTGTGWCAALLSARLGEANVVSVEVDETVAENARKALSAAGWHPEVITGDGLLGWPERAPYDRILVTAGVRQVPRAWIEQTSPGGVLVMPWGTRYSGQDAIARLVVNADGSASGRFTGPARFMQIRSQRPTWDPGDYIPGNDWPAGTRESETETKAASILSDDLYSPVPFVVGLLVPDCAHSYGRDENETPVMWLYGLADRSWAAVYFYGDTTRWASQVYQGGPRNLWDEVEAAHRWWTERGRPGHEEFGLTVTADGRQEIWLGEPGASVPEAASAVR